MSSYLKKLLGLWAQEIDANMHAAGDKAVLGFFCSFKMNEYSGFGFGFEFLVVIFLVVMLL